MSFFADPTISRISSGTPLQNTDLGSFSFPRRLGVRFNNDYLVKNKLIGMQCKWSMYEDINFTKSLGDKFMHEDMVATDGWARCYFEGVFPKDKAYLKLDIINFETGMLVKTLYFEFKKSYQSSLDGRHYMANPITGEKCAKNGFLYEIIKTKVLDNNTKQEKTVFRRGSTTFKQEKVLNLATHGDNANLQLVDTNAIIQTSVRYSEKPKMLFLINNWLYFSINQFIILCLYKLNRLYKGFIMGFKTNEQFIAELIEKFGNQFDYSNIEYKNNVTKVSICCNIHGVFEIRPQHLLRYGCKKCNLEKRREQGLRKFLDKAIKTHNNKYDYSKVEYVASNKKVCIICPIHGEFYQDPTSHGTIGQGCPKCANIVGGLKRSGANSIAHRENVKEKRKNTCLERYGATSWSSSKHGREVQRQIVLESDMLERMERTCMKRYGSRNWSSSEIGRKTLSSIMGDSEMIKKIHDGLMKTGRYSKSKCEDNCYQLLLSKFNEFDICRQYKSALYPYRCDFYIKSIDAYIELNVNWTHGFHFFNENDEFDKLRLDYMKLKSITSPYYKNAIHVWTVSDVLKRKTAIKNNLNYLVFWKYDLSDVKSWLNTLP